MAFKNLIVHESSDEYNDEDDKSEEDLLSDNLSQEFHSKAKLTKSLAKLSDKKD
jgi:hypothetical protein